jgi:putative membrane protein
METEFFDEKAREEVAAAVREVESSTGAEVVVAVRHSAARYRHVDFLVGAAAALAALTLLVFSPRPFAVATIPLDVAVVFALGAFASAHSPTLRRMLSGRKTRAAEIARAARAAFVDLGVSKTRGRTGVLVYVAMLERAVELVPDVGLEVARTPRFAEAAAALSRALQPAPDLARFVTALRGLGAPLAEICPRAADDVNELPDEMSAD